MDRKQTFLFEIVLYGSLNPSFRLFPVKFRTEDVSLQTAARFVSIALSVKSSEHFETYCYKFFLITQINFPFLFFSLNACFDMKFQSVHGF